MKINILVDDGHGAFVLKSSHDWDAIPRPGDRIVAETALTSVPVIVEGVEWSHFNTVGSLTYTGAVHFNTVESLAYTGAATPVEHAVVAIYCRPDRPDDYEELS